MGEASTSLSSVASLVDSNLKSTPGAARKGGEADHEQPTKAHGALGADGHIVQETLPCSRRKRKLSGQAGGTLLPRRTVSSSLGFDITGQHHDRCIAMA